MKQIGLALVQYAQDSDDQFPPIAQTAIKQTWRETVYPYVKSTGVYICPDDYGNESHYSLENLPHSYAANFTGWNTIENANSVITTVDTRGNDGPEWNMTRAEFALPATRELYTHKPRHIFYEHPIGRVNCLFADGHVKSMWPESTMTPTNFWTRDNAPFTGPNLQNAQAILRHAEGE